MKQQTRRWSTAYKKSINCKQPRGFSQRQYCNYGRRRPKTKRQRTHKKRIGGAPLPNNMLNRTTNIKKPDGTTVKLTLASFDRVLSAKQFQEVTAQTNYAVPIITLQIPVSHCSDPVIVSTHFHSFLLIMPEHKHVLTSINVLSMQEVNSVIKCLEMQTPNYQLLYKAGIQPIDTTQLSCSQPIELSNPHLQSVLQEVNEILQLRCSNLRIEIKPHYALSCNTLNTYRSCTQLNNTSVMVCLTNIETSECVASVEMYTSESPQEVIINSYTSPICQRKQYNKFLRGITIYFANFIFSEADTLTSEADNPVSAKIMIDTFGAVGYNMDKQNVPYEEADYTALSLTNESRTHAINVCFDLLQTVPETFCRC